MNYVEGLRKIVGHRPLILAGSVTVVMDNEKRILLQKRKSTSYGMWGLPDNIVKSHRRMINRFLEIYKG